jgi:hypothetical protein
MNEKTNGDFLDYLADSEEDETYNEWLQRVAPELATEQEATWREERKNWLLRAKATNEALLNDPSEYVRLAAQRGLDACIKSLKEVE